MAGDKRSEDDLAHTATAPGSDSQRATDAAAIGESLGRYRLQRELGAGGMGVVHAAFDPDLERRVALKVLRNTESADARQRLLREARAMARLAHPNVVAVHEVGTSGGRDFIAMELVDGDTLDDWLRAERRSERDIIQAFVAAGRGLAAAHAAGLVHRDFKPRNVLRHKDGRIVVTDFGLVLGIESSSEVSLETTLLPSEAALAQGTASALSGLTETGSVLGTPAYMAPEQWTGAAAGPATDQFSFCVALWEALAGDRPFRGATLETQKAAVLAGSEKLDDTKLPRRLRKPLRRGLEADPTKRWPTMNALLAAIVRAERRPGVALTIASGAVVLAAVMYVALGRGGGDGPVCEAPALDPAKVWSASRAADLRARDQAQAAKVFDTTMARYHEARGRACAAPPTKRESRLACLDGVLARVELVAQATFAVRDSPRVDAAALLVDPKVCETERPPRLVHSSSAELRAITVEWLRLSRDRAPFTETDAKALVARAGSEPCANAVARILALDGWIGPDRPRELEEAEQAAQRCGDDRISSDVAMSAAQESLSNGLLDLEVSSRLKRAEVLAERVSQPDVEADLESLRSSITARADKLDEAIRHAAAAMTLYAESGRVRAQIGAAIEWLSLRELRGKDDDIAAAPALLAEWRALAVRELGESDSLVRSLDRLQASRLWESGDVAGADAKLTALTKPIPTEKPVRVRGRVVDGAGAPVPAATVFSGPSFYGDSVAAANPSDRLRSATTAPDGTFEIPDAPTDGIIIAQLGDRRSPAMRVDAEVTLALAPTSRIEGKVELHGERASSVRVGVRDKAQPVSVGYSLLAPVRADGTYAIDGVPRSRLLVHTIMRRPTSQQVSGTEIDVKQPIMRDVNIEMKTSKRTVHVIVRSQVGVPVDNAQVIVLPGAIASSNLLVLMQSLQTGSVKLARPIQGEQAPKPVIAKAKSGDFYATLTEAPEGVASACAVALPKHLDDQSLAKKLKVPENLAKVLVPCVPVGATDEVVVVEVPPWPRFD